MATHAKALEQRRREREDDNRKKDERKDVRVSCKSRSEDDRS